MYNYVCICIYIIYINFFWKPNQIKMFLQFMKFKNKGNTVININNFFENVVALKFLKMQEHITAKKKKRSNC
jgi:hypothetical protein